MEDVKNPLNHNSFKFCGFEPYQRKDGEWTELRIWETKCKTCNKSFIVKTVLNATKFEHSHSFMTINCSEHRKKQSAYGQVKK